MFLKRTLSSRARKRRQNCAQCQRIRLFLLLASALIMGIYLIDKESSTLSNLTPMKMALAVLCVGAIASVIRVLQYFADKKKDS
jgi:uncharacterized membrane protein